MSEPAVPPPPPPSAPPPPPPAASSNRGVMIVLSYLWILALVPLLVEKDDPEVQWHAKHGLVLLVAEIVVWVGITILNMVLGMVFGPLACVISILSLALFLGVVVLHIMCIVKGINGQRLIIPGISQYADRF